MVELLSNNYHRIISYWKASALFGSTAIGYGDLFDRKVDDKSIYFINKTYGKTFLKYFTFSAVNLCKNRAI